MARRLAAPAPLFVYGTLQFPEVMQALILRVPPMQPVVVPGWQAAAMPPKVYPVLIQADQSQAAGHLLDDLNDQEWAVLDGFEDPMYELYSVQTTTGVQAWAYAGTTPPSTDGPWDKDSFASQHLAAYAERCQEIGKRLRAID